MITEAWAMGGAQLDTFYSLRYQQADSEVELVAGSDGPLIRACQDAGIPARVVPMANRVFDPLADVRCLLALVAHFRRCRPDLVHTHSSKAGVLGRVAAKVAGVPIIVHTYHGPSFHAGQPRFVSSSFRLVERLCAPLADQLVAVSDSTAREFENSGIRSREGIVTIASGIDFSRFPAHPFHERESVRSELSVGAGDVCVVSVAHLMKDKGHEVLIETAGILAQKNPLLKFVIVGIGPLEVALRQSIARAGLEDRILLFGDRDDVPRILAAGDIFVQTSYREGLSRSLVEALYSGLAVVASDVGGTSEVIRHGETGLLVTAGSATQLATAIADLVERDDFRARLGRAGRTAVGEARSIEAMGSAWQALYNDLACRKSVGRDVSRWPLHVTRGEAATHERRGVVFVIDSLVPGGAEGHVVRIASGLRERGWRVSVFCLSRRGGLIRNLERLGVTVVGGRPSGPSFSIRLLRSSSMLYRYLRCEQPSLVVTFLNASDTIGTVTARMAGVRCVVSSRRYFHGYRGVKLAVYRLATFLSDCCSDGIIAVSDAVRRQAIDEGTPARMIETIYNSVQVPAEIGREARSFSGSPVIGSVGHLHPDKGYAVLIEALPAMLTHVPETRLVLVGDGQEREALELQAANKGLGEQISFLGERLDVPDLLRQFDIFAFPSLREGMPNALLEAMASGLPVVASAVGGIVEIVRDEDNGLLVPPNCPEALSQAIVRLWRDDDLRRRLALEGQRSVAERFGDTEREVERTEAVYLRILGLPYASCRARDDALTVKPASHLTEPAVQVP